MPLGNCQVSPPILLSLKLLTYVNLGCTQKREEGIYAHFGLLQLSLECHCQKIEIANLQDPEDYANKLKQEDDYYG